MPPSDDSAMPNGVVNMFGWVVYEEPTRLDQNAVLKNLRSMDSVWFVTTKYAQYFCMVDIQKKNNLDTVCHRLKITSLNRAIHVRWNTFMRDALHNGPPYPLHNIPGGPEFLLPLMEDQLKFTLEHNSWMYNPLLLVWDRNTSMEIRHDE